MSGFLYFLPQHDKPVELGDCEALGIAHAFDAAPQSSPIAGRTPTGAAGMLVWSQQRLGELQAAYRPDEQAWRKMPGGDAAREVYVGYYLDRPPGPESLARAQQLAGEWVAFADDREWLVPRLRFFSAQSGFVTALPIRADLDEAGRWVVGETDPRYRRLDAIAARLYAGMIDGELGLAPRLAPVELLDIACELLGVNYVVSRVECAMLRLLTNDALLMRVARVAMDWETALAWAEKKNVDNTPSTPAGSTTCGGERDS